MFKSFFAAGFECSTHVRRSGYRLDLVAATAHDRLARLDYERLGPQGIRVTREGVRWHLVETKPGHYDFSSVLPIVEAARATDTQVLWDLCHFGWPDHLELFSEDFVTRLADYGAAFVSWLGRECQQVPFVVPVNEISYFSWASGDEGSMYPFVTGRGFELKQHLVRATIEAIKSIRSVEPKTRFVQVDPIIHVVASPKHPEEAPEAEAYRASQYQAFDMLSGRLSPELGGGDQFLDIIGVNYYPHNQWIYNLKNWKRVRKFQPIYRRNPMYRPFREMLAEIYKRYNRPLFIAETGAEDRRRAGWFSYVCEEALAAVKQGIQLEGICLYPILNHPGWVDDRHCYNALWDYADEHGNRVIYPPLARELRRWRAVFEETPQTPKPATQNGSLNATHLL
ncbi:MAG TPA: beta-glucosidase [Patescibacteria group bacterium]|nr:beta-glucosidase [Patescibacteria group bacterium]